MVEKTDRISRQLFSIGLVATAVLMPLDLITQGQLKVEWLILFLLVQRPFIYLFASSSKFKTLGELFINAIPFTAPVVAIALTTLTATYRSLAIAYAAVMIALLARGWLISRFVTKGDVHLFEKTTLIVSALLVAFGYFQFFGDIIGLPQNVTFLLSHYRAFTAFPFPRVHSLSLEPLYFANYLLLPLSILLLRLRSRNSPKRQHLYGLLLVAILALIIASVSRSAVLGLLVSLPIYLFMVRKETAYLKRLALVGVSTAVLTVALVGAPKYLPKFEFKQHSGDSLKIFGTHITDLRDASAETRYELWPKAINLFRQDPLTGVGPDNSRALLHPDEYSPDKPYAGLQPVNNDYLALLAEQGLIGILGLLPLAFVLLRAIWGVIKKQYKNPAAAYVIAAIAIAVQVNSFGGLALQRTWVVLGMLLATWRLSQLGETRKS